MRTRRIGCVARRIAEKMNTSLADLRVRASQAAEWGFAAGVERLLPRKKRWNEQQKRNG
jgi:hypothetical protein